MGGFASKSVNAVQIGIIPVYEHTCILTPTGEQTLFKILLSDDVFGEEQTNAVPTTRAFLSNTSLKQTREMLSQTKKKPITALLTSISAYIKDEPFKEEPFLWIIVKYVTHNAAQVVAYSVEMLFSSLDEEKKKSWLN